jgi:hypothetical protein
MNYEVTLLYGIIKKLKGKKIEKNVVFRHANKVCSRG